MAQTKGQARKQGPLGISISLADPFGLGKLAIDANDEELERAIAFEGYQRGLDEFGIFTLLSNRRGSRREAAAGNGGIRTGIQLDPFDMSEGLQTLVRQERKRYESFVTKEFDGLSEFFRNMFADPYGPNAQRSKPDFSSVEWQANNRAYYLEMRSRYYLAGYDDPARKIFDHIAPATLLGKPVTCGLHTKFAEKLRLLDGLLEGWKTGLSGQIKAQIADVGGFVPRVVKGSRTLSNHALGLAIDVDYLSNPHIRHPKVMQLFNALVADTGFKFDQPAVADDDLRGVSRLDEIIEIHRRSSRASRKIQAWLAQRLPRYETLNKTIEEAQQAQKAQVEMEKKVMRDRKGKIDTTGMTSTTKYLDLEQKALAEIGSDTDMRDMRVIEECQFEDIQDRKLRYREFLRQVKAWIQDGIQSFPLELAAGLAHPDLGLRWGEEYERHKDAMHFEFEGAVPPDVKGGRDPELADLLGPAAKPWYLVVKRKARH